MAQQRATGSGASCFRSGVKVFLLLLAAGLCLYILVPPLYWRLMEAVTAARHVESCPPCSCHCRTEIASMMPPGLANTSTADCQKVDPNIREELHKNTVELLTEELKLQEAVAKESEQRADSTLLDAKKLASQYQKEAEKCNIGMETCEEAREKAEAALIVQKKMSALWEQRARQLGWTELREKHEQERSA